MSSLWLSLLLAAASWLYIVPEFEPPAPIGWGVMVLGAVAFAVQGLRTTRHPITADAAAVLVVPAAVAAFLIPLPYTSARCFSWPDVCSALLQRVFRTPMTPVSDCGDASCSSAREWRSRG